MVTLAHLSSFPMLLAQAGPKEQSYTLPWAVVLLCVILGLMIALKPAKREITVKKADE